MSSQDLVEPAPPGYTVNLVDPESLGYKLIITATVMAVCSTIFIGLRLYTRSFLVRSLGWDDCWIALAWVLSIVLSVMSVIETRYGMGIHIWDITIENFNIYLKLQLIIGAAYILGLCFAKVSICCFYIRLSPDGTFRLMVFAAIAFVSALSFAALMVLIFSCSPVAASWDLALAALPTTSCLDRPADYLAQSSLNILSDIIIFLLPLKMVWRLHLPFAQKLSVSALLALGLLVCIVSVIRLKSVVVVLNSTDASWDTNDLLIWTTVEFHMAIICACIATLKPFAKRFFPVLFGHTIRDGMTSPSLPGRNTKMGSSRLDDEDSFPMDNYHGHVNRVQDAAMETSQSARGQRQRYGDAESQQSIMGEIEHDLDIKEGEFTHKMRV